MRKREIQRDGTEIKDGIVHDSEVLLVEDVEDGIRKDVDLHRLRYLGRDLIGLPKTSDEIRRSPSHGMVSHEVGCYKVSHVTIKEQQS